MKPGNLLCDIPDTAHIKTSRDLGEEKDQRRLLTT